MEGHHPAAAACHGQVQPLLLLRYPQTCPRMLKNLGLLDTSCIFQI